MDECPVVEFEQVSKDFPVGVMRRGRLQAVRNVSFRIERGEVFGLVGPNRAGKTTLVKMLLSLCRPTSGRIERLGQPASRRATLAQVGYIHENQAFPRYLSARDLLEYYGALSLIPEPAVKARVPALLEQVGLADRSVEPISQFSKGMVQRLGMAQALINHPELLVMDEPSEGLDMAGRQTLRDIVASQRCQGRSVLYVSHLLPDVESLCDRIGVIVAGQIRYVGPVKSLTSDPSSGTSQPLETALAELYRAAEG